MMLTDTFGWVKRNIKSMNEYEKKKTLNEVIQIQKILERELKQLKGAV